MAKFKPTTSTKSGSSSFRLSPNDIVRFVDTHRPRLKAGDYVVNLTQELPNRKFSATREGRFAVAGERYTVKESEVHAVFPPPGTHGAYHSVLPHVLFERSTLPWERSPRRDAEVFLSPSWMALLLFTSDEAPKIQTVKVKDLRHDVSIQEALADPQRKSGAWQHRWPEVTQHAEDVAKVIDVPWSQLKQQVPTYEDLRALAHVRDIQYAHTAPEGAARPPELAAIIGNRLPSPGSECTVHLVSLEGSYRCPRAKGDDGLAWDDGHEVFKLNGDGANGVADLLRSAKEKLSALRAGFQDKIDQAEPVEKHALERLRSRLAVEIRLRSGEAPSFLAPLVDANVLADATRIKPHQIESLLNKHQLDQVRDQKTVQVFATVTNIGPVVATINMRHGTDAVGHVVQHLAASISLPPAFALETPFVSPEINSAEEARNNLLNWLRAADDAGSDTLVLQVNAKPAFVDDNNALHEIAGSPTIGEKILEAIASGDIYISLSNGRQARALGSLNESATKATWTLDVCRPLADPSLSAILEQAQGAGARELLLEVGLPPLEMAPASPSPFPDGADVSFDDVVSISKATLTPRWWARAQLTWDIELSGGLALDSGEKPNRFIDMTLALRGSKPNSSGEPQVMIATFTIRHPEHPYFDHQGAETLHPDAPLRLISLKSWGFTCDPSGSDFADLLQNLDGIGHDAELRLPFNQPKKSKAWPYLQAGHVPLPHLLRQGEKTVSWYRGPLIPQLPVAGDHATLPLPARTSDELLIFDNEIGMFDVSYAAAWELGRLLALADKEFSTKLHIWKRARRRALTYLRQQVDIAYLPVADPPTSDVDLPEDLDSWLQKLTLLDGVPFNYFLSDEQLLGPESIRFFVVDPLWIECLRDGALSIGRVLRDDHGYDHDLWTSLPQPPRISGFIMRSAVASGYPKMAVQTYHRESGTLTDEQMDAWEHKGHLDNSEIYHHLTELRRVNLGANLMMSLFYDAQTHDRELNLAEFHLPPQILHFGVEQVPGIGPSKLLRDPSSGDQLSRVSKGRPLDPVAHVVEAEISMSGLTASIAAGVDPGLVRAFVFGVADERDHQTILKTWKVKKRPRDATSQDTFSAAVAKCLRNVPDSDRYVSVIVAKAVGDTSNLELGPVQLTALAQENVPENILIRLMGKMMKRFSILPEEKPARPVRAVFQDTLQRVLHPHDAQQEQNYVQMAEQAGGILWVQIDKRISEEVDLAPDLWRTKQTSWWAWIRGSAGDILENEFDDPEMLEKIVTMARQSVQADSEAGAKQALGAKINAALGSGASTDAVIDALWQTKPHPAPYGPELSAAVCHAVPGGVLNISRLFSEVGDRLRLAGVTPVGSGDFGLQMLDAAPMVRILRRPPE